MRVIVDTNIFISGLINKANPPGRIVEAVLRGIVTAVMSETTFAELSAVLRRPRLSPYFQRAEVDVDEFLATLRELVEFVEPQTAEDEIRDNKDRPFLDLAATPPKPDFLITGDKDFEHNRYAGVRVISASRFVAELH